MKKSEIKAKAARYLKIVEWSDEDGCFVGRIPGLAFGGIHGDDEAKVYQELCEVAEEWIEILEKDGKPLPEPTAGKKFSGKFLVRVSPDVHQLASMRAEARKLSLNQFVAEAIFEHASPRGASFADLFVASFGRMMESRSKASPGAEDLKDEVLKEIGRMRTRLEGVRQKRTPSLGLQRV